MAEVVSEISGRSINGGWGNSIICPLCSEWEGRCVISNPPITPMLTGPTGGGSESLLVTPMRCEDGHEWELCLLTHEGSTYVFGRSPGEGAEVR
jgi:hypothetical protein